MPLARDGVEERPFFVADGVILIGAASVALALVRSWQNPRWCSWGIGLFPDQALSPGRRILLQTLIGISWTIPFAITVTITLLAIRLRSPRPAIREIATQPGAVACASVSLAIAFRMGQEIFCWVLGYLTRPQSLFHLPSPPFVRFDNPGFHPPPGEWIRRALLETFPILVSPSAALVIAVGWIVLALTGQWHPNSGWIDRCGRWLGFYWIALGVTIAVSLELMKFIM
jgi:hypothetical protein